MNKHDIHYVIEYHFNITYTNGQFKLNLNAF